MRVSPPPSIPPGPAPGGSEPFRPGRVSRSPSHPPPDSIPEGRRGREGVIFVFNGGAGNGPFLELGHTKKSAE